MIRHKFNLYLSTSYPCLIWSIHMRPPPRLLKETMFDVLKNNQGKTIMTKNSYDIFYADKEYEWIVNDQT